MNNPATYKDEELMQDIKAGNMLAFDMLYKKYSVRVHKFANSILKSTEESENIVQDVFLSLWENRHKVEKDSSVKYYIFSIAYNLAITDIRKKTREAQFIEYLMSLQDITQEPDILESEYNALEDKVKDIIDHLPERQKQIFLLHKAEGLKYREIAKMLNISVNTIENHMSRAYKTIREKLGKYSLMGILFFYLFVK